MRWVIVLAGVLGAVGVAIGAFAAHGLEKSLAEQGLDTVEIVKKLEQCDVAVRYHMIHTLALLSIGLWTGPHARRRTTLSVLFFLAGVLLFSGGLYSMVFLGEMGHWAIVPLGGLCFILGWLAVISLGWGPATRDEIPRDETHRDKA